jgi:hypothetical protein
MRYVADLADHGPLKGEWVVIDRDNGSLAVQQPFRCKPDAGFCASHMNRDRADEDRA